MVRFTFFFILAGMSLLMPFQAFLLCALVYIFFWEGYELLCIGVIVDSVFGPTAFSFMYTLSLGIMLGVFALIRPYLSWYNTEI